MSLSMLDAAEREVVLHCLDATVKGPFFDDAEFHTLIGLYRHEVADLVKRWTAIDDTDEDAANAINNCLVNLLWYPHCEGEKLRELVGASEAQLERIFDKYKKGLQT
jgi:hypothetical protein